MGNIASSVVGPKDSRKVVLIDLSNIFWGAWHAAANAQGQTQVEAAFDIALGGVRRCAREGELVAVCLDVGRSFRKAMFADYKAQRPEKDATALDTLARVKERLIADGYLLWGVDTFEADDIIAGACELARERSHDVVICSADKDLLQLTAHDGVTVLRTWGKWPLFGCRETREKFGGIEPFQVMDFLALVGDTSDNIKGAPGVGEKTASQLLLQFGDIPGIYEALRADPASVAPNKSPGISKIAQSLIDNEALVRSALQLVALNPPPSGSFRFEDIYEKREITSPTTQDAPMPDEPTEDVVVEAPQHEKKAAEAPKPAEKPQEAPKDTAVALYQGPQSFETALEPKGLAQAEWLATHFASSGLYKQFPNKSAILAVALMGRSIGLGMAQSMNLFHFVEGRVCPHAHLIISMAKRHKSVVRLDCIETSATKAIYEIELANGRKRQHPYTIDDARKAGLADRKIWLARPAEMLRKTCAVQLIRMEVPDAALGLYSIEELGYEVEAA